jgi:hypothetical protein
MSDGDPPNLRCELYLVTRQTCPPWLLHPSMHSCKSLSLSRASLLFFWLQQTPKTLASSDHHLCACEPQNNQPPLQITPTGLVNSNDKLTPRAPRSHLSLFSLAFPSLLVRSDGADCPGTFACLLNESSRSPARCSCLIFLVSWLLRL